MALIPARSGSKRVPNKNIRELAGHPLMAYTIVAARQGGIFTDVVVSSDSPEYGEVAAFYGASFLLRPAELAQDSSPDILWVKHALGNLPAVDAFAIMRPTNPFRPAGMVAAAWDRFLENQPADSLRAVETVRQHPGKMWILTGARMLPLLPWWGPEAPWHSMATQLLPLICVQTANLEIVWTKTVLEQDSISGATVIPFITSGLESLDINTEVDWLWAESLADELPDLKKEIV